MGFLESVGLGGLDKLKDKKSIEDTLSKMEKQTKIAKVPKKKKPVVAPEVAKVEEKVDNSFKKEGSDRAAFKKKLQEDRERARIHRAKQG